MGLIPLGEAGYSDYQNLYLFFIENIDIENLVSKWKSWKDVSEAALEYGEKQADPALTHLMWFYRNQKPQMLQSH